MPDFVPPKTTTPKLVRVEQAKEPPADLLKKEFSLDPGILTDASGDGRVVTEDKTGKETKVELKPVEEKKVEEAKVEPKPGEEKKEEKKELPSVLKAPEKKEEEKKGEVVKMITPEKKDRGERDLSAFPVEDHAILRQMSNEAFIFVSKLIDTKKELEKVKDNTFLQHPDAYLLSPEYKENQSKYALAQKEANYWQTCLETMEEGKPIRSLEGWDEKGNPVLGEEYQPTKRLEEMVRINMNQCFNVAGQAKAELQTLPKNFSGRVKEDLRTIQAERTSRFAWVADPKLLDYTLEIEGAGPRTLKQIREDMVNLFPPYLRNNPATEIVGDLMIALRIQDAELREAKNGKQVAEAKKEELKRGEPSSQVKPAAQADAVGGVKEFSLDGLPK